MMRSTSRGISYRIRHLVGILTVLFILAEILLLSPSSLDPGRNSTITPVLDPAELAANFETDNQAFGLPKEKIPEYSIAGFHYTSAKGGLKQWRLVAKRAFFYNNPDKLVLAREVVAYLFNPDGSTTVMTGRSAKYYMNKKDLELFHEVKAVFPDQFTILSEYMHYQTDSRMVVVPEPYISIGDGPIEDHKRIHFSSKGLEYAMGQNDVHLKSDVHFDVIPDQPPNPEHPKVSDRTTIDSDECQIDRNQRLATFTMREDRPLRTRFVRMTQPDFFVKSRRVQLNYGDTKQKKQGVQYLTALEDVRIDDYSKPDIIRYGTGGRADFDPDKNVTVLTLFPQLYQDQDTITGDVIIMHRDSDVVEVKNSNAFSKGDLNL